MTDKELRAKFGQIPDSDWIKLGREHELETWRTANKYCGRCGEKTVPHERASENALVCPQCGATYYPHITPAVIVLVEKDNRILLQRNTHYPNRFWSLVAGFVDPCETLEDAVRREIREEASIEVANIRYAASQPWPFPSNIMIGFRADYVSGTLTPDGDEVVESNWFSRDHLPELPDKISIARKLIEQWRAE